MPGFVVSYLGYLAAWEISQAVVWQTKGRVHTNVSHDAGNDDLGAVGGLDGGAEVGIVPGVDLALALDERRVGVHVADLLGDGAVGACRRGGVSHTLERGQSHRGSETYRSQQSWS